MKYEWQKLAPLAKPCPLCGSGNVVTERLGYFLEKGFKHVTIECADCGLSYTGDAGKDHNEAYKKALEHWNRRVTR